MERIKHFETVDNFRDIGGYPCSERKEFTAEITKYMTPVPSKDKSGVVSFISSALKGLGANTNLQVVILNKQNNSFLGCAGLHEITLRSPELGIWIKKSAHGNKYGLEAVTSLINWAKNHIEYDYLKYPVDKRNISSRKIPESNGGIIDHEFKQMLGASSTPCRPPRPERALRPGAPNPPSDPGVVWRAAGIFSAGISCCEIY